ncbi:murein L,D-transpeptidase [Candidatus Uhrbacteria bacterium]|nr:murein L,D-transpeptidase [Candidatus Uhrbacteria bacterium]
MQWFGVFIGCLLLLSGGVKVVQAAELDSDQDGLSDRLEFLFGSDSAIPDTDGDGYSDGQEVFAGFSPTSTDSVRLPKSIKIHLATQQLEMQVNQIAIRVFPISSGLPRMPTPAGDFRVLQKVPRAWSKAAGLWMPWWMHFSGRGHGLHELPEWPGGKKEGVNHLGHAASHGCVRLGVGPAKELYDWTPVGTLITIVKK